MNKNSESISFYLPFNIKGSDVPYPIDNNQNQVFLLKLYLDLETGQFDIKNTIYFPINSFNLNTMPFNYNKNHSNSNDSTGKKIRKQQKKRNRICELYDDYRNQSFCDDLIYPFDSYANISNMFLGYNGKKDNDKIFLKESKIRLGSFFKKENGFTGKVVNNKPDTGKIIKPLNKKQSEMLFNNVIQNIDNNTQEIEVIINNIIQNLSYYYNSALTKKEKDRKQGKYNKYKGEKGEESVCGIINYPEQDYEKYKIIKNQLELDNPKKAKKCGNEKIKNIDNNKLINQKTDVVLIDNNIILNYSIKNSLGGDRCHLASFDFFIDFLNSFETYACIEDKNRKYNKELVVSGFDKMLAQSSYDRIYYERKHRIKFYNLVTKEQEAIKYFMVSNFKTIVLFLLLYDKNRKIMLDGLIFNGSKEKFDLNNPIQTFEPYAINKHNLEKLLDYLIENHMNRIVSIKDGETGFICTPFFIMRDYDKPIKNDFRPSFQGNFLKNIIDFFGKNSSFSDTMLNNLPSDLKSIKGKRRCLNFNDFL